MSRRRPPPRPHPRPRLPTKWMFLKPAKKFEGLDYSKVVLCFQNKLEHSTPTELRDDAL